MREFERGIPAEEIERAEESKQRGKLESRFAEHGDLDVEGVPDAIKEKFAAEKLKEKDQEISRLWKEAKALESLRDKYARAAEGDGESFSADEERWFAEGLKPEYLRKAALTEAWETAGTLDIEDVPADEKVAFADERLGYLRNLQKTEQYRHSEILTERINRLELLREQYANESADADGGVASQAA
jgi:hypothetical protein